MLCKFIKNMQPSSKPLSTATLNVPNTQSLPQNSSELQLFTCKSNIPFSRNVNFTGRRKELNDLQNFFSDDGHATLKKQVLYGMGGMGKTQIALEYCYLNMEKYDLVWWLRAEEAVTIASDYVALALELGLYEQNAQEQSEVINAVRKWLKSHDNWLLVFDNAQNHSSLSDYLPNALRGHLLVTSLNQNWKAFCRESLEIKIWQRDESIEFLQNRTRKHDQAGANDLAYALGDLPLALEQAGAYIESTGVTMSEYLQLFKTHQAELLANAAVPIEHENSFVITFELSIEAAKNIEPLSLVMVNLCALVAADAIPQTFIRSCGEKLQQEDNTLQDTIAFNRATQALRQYSLIQIDGDNFSIHRLVQNVAQKRMSSEAKEQYRIAAMKVLNLQFPKDGFNDPTCWQVCTELAPHVETIVYAVTDDTSEWEELSLLLNDFAGYQGGRASYDAAEPLLRRALGIREKHLGPDHLDVATSLNNLSSLLQKKGKYAEAKSILERSVAIYEKDLGSNHPWLATGLNNLAILLKELGNYAAAEPLLRRALAIREKALDPVHPQIAQSLNSLAMLLFSQGNYTAGEPLLRRALAIFEKAYDPDHPDIAQSLNNLATLLFSQGNYAEAKSLLGRSLAIKEKHFGSNHPSVATGLNNLALLLKELGNYTDAEPLLRRALAIREEALNPDHPDIAQSLNNLASLLFSQGNYAEAKSLLSRSLAIYEKELGSNHPNTLASLKNLNTLLNTLLNTMK